MKISERSLLKKVLSQPAAPYHEEFVADIVREAVTNLGLRLREDKYGNLIAYYRNASTAPLAIDAHMDHPGIEIVQSGKDLNGQTLGGVPVKFLKGSRVLVNGKVPGKITRVKKSKKDTLVSIQTSKKPQDPRFAVWDVTACKISGDRVSARAADDLAGVAAILAVLRRAVKRRLKTNLIGIFTRAEEVGFAGGSALAASGILPKKTAIISLEASNHRPGVVVGGGPVIRVGDRRTLFDARLTRFMELISEDTFKKPMVSKGNIPVRALMDGGVCHGTAYAAYGYRVAAMAVPIRNYHNIGTRSIQPEIFSYTDWLGMVTFLEALSCHWPKMYVWLRNDRKKLMDRMTLLRKRL